jgi:hypothetical protein
MSVVNVRSSGPMQQDAIQGAPKPVGRYSLSLPSIASRIKPLIFPAFALLALSCIPGAAAGPMAYGICVEGCFLLFPPLAPLCVVGCIPILSAPTP